MMTKDDQNRLNNLCDEIDGMIIRLVKINEQIRANYGYSYAISGAIEGLRNAVRDNRQVYERLVERTATTGRKWDIF